MVLAILTFVHKVRYKVHNNIVTINQLTKNMEENMNTKKRVLVSIVALVMMLSAITSFALVYPTQFYSNRSWTYTYDGPSTNNYNCLAYALGITTTWVWPWTGNPTDSQVTSYLTSLGYKKFSYGQPYQAKIISYGTTSSIGHFSKSSSTLGGSCITKWGGLERFKHDSWNPYNTGSDQWSSAGNPFYGYAVSYYY